MIQVVFLFGIIVPTLVTVACFVGFLVCYFRSCRRRSSSSPTTANASATSGAHAPRRKRFHLSRRARIYDTSATSSSSYHRPATAFSFVDNTGTIESSLAGKRISVVIVVDGHSYDRKSLRTGTIGRASKNDVLSSDSSRCSLVDFVPDVDDNSCRQFRVVCYTGLACVRCRIDDDRSDTRTGCRPACPCIVPESNVAFASTTDGKRRPPVELNYLERKPTAVDDVVGDAAERRTPLDNCYVDVIASSARSRVTSGDGEPSRSTSDVGEGRPIVPGGSVLNGARAATDDASFRTRHQLVTDVVTQETARSCGECERPASLTIDSLTGEVDDE